MNPDEYTSPDKLRFVNLPLMDIDICKSIYTYEKFTIYEGNVCAGNPNEEIGVCVVRKR